MDSSDGFSRLLDPATEARLREIAAGLTIEDEGRRLELLANTIRAEPPWVLRRIASHVIRLARGRSGVTRRQGLASLIGIGRPALSPLFMALRECQNRWRNQWVVCHLIYALGQVALGLDAGARLFWAKTIESDMAATALGPAHALAPRVIELLRQGDQGPAIGTDYAVRSSALAQAYRKVLASRKRPKPKKEVDPQVRDLVKALTARDQTKRLAALTQALSEKEVFLQQVASELGDLLKASRSCMIHERALGCLFVLGKLSVRALKNHLVRNRSARLPLRPLRVLYQIGRRLGLDDRLDIARFIEIVVRTKWPGDRERPVRMINMLRIGRQLPRLELVGTIIPATPGTETEEPINRSPK